MPGFWVISANLNPTTRHLEVWEEIIRLERRIFIGWDEDNAIGDVFVTQVEMGDLVLVASRSNAKKQLCACGRVVSEPIPATDLDVAKKYGGWARNPHALEYNFSRLLEPFAELDPTPARYGLKFDGKSGWIAFGQSPRPPAIYPLKPDEHEGDRRVCEWLARKVAGRPALATPAELARRLTAPPRRPNGDSGPGTAGLTPEQVRQGFEGEEFVLRRLKRPGGLDGLQFKEDRRRRPCGYDFLCSDSDGRDVRVEVKTFTADGRIFLPDAEWRQASANPASHCLIGVLASPSGGRLEIAGVLRSPYNGLLRAEPSRYESVQYVLRASQIFPTACGKDKRHT